MTRPFRSHALETRWSLYVDESGDFSDAWISVVVGGLLVRADAERGGPEPLRRQLLGAIPIEFWPLHAAQINLPVWFALVHAAVVADRTPVDPTSAAAIACLRTHCGAHLDAALADLTNGHEPRFDALRAMNHILRQHQPVDYITLEHWGRTLWAKVATLVEALAASNGGADLPAVAVFAAGETDLSPIDPAEGSMDEDARYKELLACALERVASVLGRTEGRHHVGLHVLGRRVFNRVLGRHTPLLLSDVAALAQPINERFAPRVRLVANEVARFDRDVHPALVLADFAANHARRALHGPCRELTSTESDLQSRIPAAVRSGRPVLSHLAGDGLARSWIAWAGGHMPSPPRQSLALTKQRRRWACEQAYEWVTALGGTWS